MTDHLFLTLDETAAILRVGRQTVRANHQQFGSIKIGNRLRFPIGVIHRLAGLSTMPDQCPPSPEPAPTTEKTKGIGASDGEKTASKNRRVDSTPSLTPDARPSQLPNDFKQAFPEYAHLA